jgi:surfeit locus 1 family protein
LAGDERRSGQQPVIGLLRMTEAKGGFLRRDDPADDRWYSRDVAAIARARHLTDAAPYFIDADVAAGAPNGPVGGLTVVDLPNNHLVYALTWFGLAALSVAAAMVLIVDERRSRPHRPAARPTGHAGGTVRPLHD